MPVVKLPIKIALAVFGLAFLLHLIGFAAPYWHLQEWQVRSRQHTFNYGLWRFCHEESDRYRRVVDCGDMVSEAYGRDYIRAAQFFETVGFLTALVSLLLLLLSICIKSCGDRRILPVLSSITAFGAAGCIILGCIIFGAKDEEKDNLSWAFALALFGGILFAVAGIIILVFSVIKKGTTTAEAV